MPTHLPAQAQGPALKHTETMLWIGDIPQHGAAVDANREAVIFADRGESISYAELDRQCDAFATRLLEFGLRSGDRVAYLGKNSSVYLPVMLGALRVGVVLVPLNWRLAADEIRYQLDDSESRLLFCDPEFAATASNACIALSRPPRIISTEADGGAGLRALLLQPAQAHAVPHAADQVVLQLYTSGTTGKPKGVLLSHAELSIARHIDVETPELDFLTMDCRTLSAMPHFHIGGMSWIMMTLCRVGTLVLTADASAQNMLNLIRDYRVEFVLTVPTVLRSIVDILHASGETAPPLKGILYGAMPIGAGLLKDLINLLGCQLLQKFGMTETAGCATYLAPAEHRRDRNQRLQSVGKPFPGVSIEIRGPDRRLLGIGEHGEIWIKSPTLMLGYWKLPEKTVEAIVDGWYATGDGGYLDADGFLYLTDRIKDMIVSGGENIYPVEVEEAVRQHPAVLDAAVIGLPDAHWGEKVVAVVELRPAHSVDEGELRQFVREHIAGYKCPKAIYFTAALPRTASGKVRRVELREQLKKN